MESTSWILGHWPDFRSLLPSGLDLEGRARERRAFTRARGVKDVDALLRLALGYGACGMSLRECCAWASALGLAQLSDTALLKRLSKAADWLGDIVAALLADQPVGPVLAGRWSGYRLRVIDATSICPPGATGATWRLHASYDLGSGQMDHIELTDAHTAESLKHFTFAPNDIGMADCCYARPRDLRPVVDGGAHLVVRTGWNSLRLLEPDGSVFDLMAALAKLHTQEGETLVGVDEHRRRGQAPPLVLRLIMRRKSAKDAAEAQKRLIKEARRKGRTPDPRSLEAAKYILLLTSLPADAFPTADVLALYRLRWQIEIAFKRFKSLAGLDRLPAKHPDLARAWIYARLIGIVIAERIAGQVPDSSPSGTATTKAKSVTMALRQNHPRKPARRHPRAAAMERDAQPLLASPPVPA